MSLIEEIEKAIRAGIQTRADVEKARGWDEGLHPRGFHGMWIKALSAMRVGDAITHVKYDPHGREHGHGSNFHSHVDVSKFSGRKGAITVRIGEQGAGKDMSIDEAATVLAGQGHHPANFMIGAVGGSGRADQNAKRHARLTAAGVDVANIPKPKQRTGARKPKQPSPTAVPDMHGALRNLIESRPKPAAAAQPHQEKLQDAALQHLAARYPHKLEVGPHPTKAGHLKATGFGPGKHPAGMAPGLHVMATFEVAPNGTIKRA